MVFPIVGGDGKPTGYEIDNSLRFNDGDSARLSRAQSNGNQDKWTWSGWVKRGNISSNQCFFATTNGSTTSFDAKFKSTDAIEVYNYFGGGFDSQLITDRLFRDVSAWYHIVVVYDSGNATESDRLQIYINGTEETSFSTTNYPSLNADSDLNVSGSTLDIGRQANGAQFFDGYMSEINFIDGQALAPTDFGETNDNGVWIPKKYTGSYGTNGFFLEFKQTGTSANASGIGADTSGGTNHFTPTNLAAIDVTTDTPTNNFATLNPLSNSLQASYSEGNLNEATNDNYGAGATQAFANGKWYWEVKITAGDNNLVGIANSDEQHRFTTVFGINNYSITVYGVNGQIQKEGSVAENTSVTYGANDIVGVAVDMDSGTRTVQFYKNGSTLGSAVTLPTNWGFTLPMIRKGGSSQTSSFNFGNPAFAISSGNADANGYGNFEYAVPSGYYSLCTKNLAEFG